MTCIILTGTYQMSISAPASQPIKPADQLSLVKSACKGSMEDFGRLYDHYSPLLMGLIMRMTAGNQHRSEEVLQRTFMAVWKEMQTPGFREEQFFMRLVAFARGLCSQGSKNNAGSGNLKAIELVYFKGLTHAEAAELLQMTEADLKTRIRTELKAYRGKG